MSRTSLHRYATVILVCCGTAQAADPIPAHPSQIDFPPLTYTPEPASAFRETLSNGVVVYIAEDRMLPTFDLSVTLRTGAAVDPSGKVGLASLVGEQMRDGGTKDMSPEAFDEAVEYLAASIRSFIGETRGRASLSCLSKDIDEGLRLFASMLRYPGFDEERFRLAKERVLQNIKRRNDSTARIMSIEWGFLMDGSDHFSNQYASSETVNNITRDDLFAFHRKYVHPGNMVIAVTGDFEQSAMLAKLESIFGDWPVGETGPTSFPAPRHEPQPGVYVVKKEDVNQGRVSIGHRAIKRGTPDEFPLHVMNGILGGAGFQSRLFRRVRSDEGLAYNTGSRFEQGVYYPGHFQCWFQSKNNSCAYATKIVLEEIESLRTKEPPPDEVTSVINYYVESFPQRFPTKMALLETYVDDEYTGRDPAYWQTYVERLRQVTPDDVRRVARQYLKPDGLVILAVGNAEELIAGGHDKAPELGLDDFGKVKRLPLRDPDTLQR